jgi:hypothetical protein
MTGLTEKKSKKGRAEGEAFVDGAPLNRKKVRVMSVCGVTITRVSVTVTILNKNLCTAGQELISLYVRGENVDLEGRNAPHPLSHVFFVSLTK